MMQISRKTFSILAVSVTAAFAFTACGGGSGNPVVGGSGEERTVQIKALDTLRFDPATVDVKRGERVRFVVTNAGQAQHEFILGDEEIQNAHEQTMATKGHMELEAIASLSLKPGETKEATVTFDEAGKILFGCHVAGHYKGGMVGTVNVP